MNRLIYALVTGSVLFFGQTSASLAEGEAPSCPAGPPQPPDSSVCPIGCDHTTIHPAVLQATCNGGGTVTVGTPGRTTPEVYVGRFWLAENVRIVSEGNESTTLYSDPFGGADGPMTVLKRATLTILEGTDPTALPYQPNDYPIAYTPVFCSSRYQPAILDGFTIQRMDPSAQDWDGLISIFGCSATIKNNIIRNVQGPAHTSAIIIMPFGTTAPSTIENNIIHYTNGPGIDVLPVGRNSQPALITGNTIFTTLASDSNPAISLIEASSATITNNLLFNSRGGVMSDREFHIIDSAYPIVIKGNTIRDNAPYPGIGIATESGTTNAQLVIGGPNPGDGNIIHGNKRAVRLDSQGLDTERTLSAVIENNYFRNNGGGIEVKNTLSLTIKNNSINNHSACAIRTGLSNNIVIEGNQLRDNSLCGIQLMADTSAPTIDINNNTISNNSSHGIRLDNANQPFQGELNAFSPKIPRF